MKNNVVHFYLLNKVNFLGDNPSLINFCKIFLHFSFLFAMIKDVFKQIYISIF